MGPTLVTRLCSQITEQHNPPTSPWLLYITIFLSWSLEVLFIPNRQKKVQCKGFGVCCGNNEPPLVLNNTTGERKCNGLNDSNCLCGGTDVPKPCPGGFYCPKPDVMKPCKAGYYCRPGSKEPDPCPVSNLTLVKNIESRSIHGYTTRSCKACLSCLVKTDLRLHASIAWGSCVGKL